MPSLPMRLLPLVLLLLGACATAPQKPVSLAPPTLVGRWEGTDDKDKKGVLLFRGDGVMTMVVDGQTMGDPNDGGEKGLKYALNRATTPMGLDVIAFNRVTGEEVGRFVGIVEFVDDNHLRFRTHFDANRPLSFEGATSQDTLVMERKVSAASAGPSVVGRWEGPQAEGSNGFIFRENGTFVLLYKGQERGDPTNGKRITYRLDASQVPTAIDVVGVEEGSPTEIVLGRGILEFKDVNHLRMRMGWEDSGRPLTFDGADANDTIELERKAELERKQ